MRFRNPFRKPETLGFKDASKEIKREIKLIKRIKNEDERQERFESLKTVLDKVMSKENIKRAVEKPNADNDGFLASLTPTQLAIGLAAVALPTMGTIFSGVALLQPFILPAIPVLIAAAVATSFVGHRLLFRSRAKELGLTTADIKYAHKMKKQQRKVNTAVMDLRTDDEVEASIKELREQFTASAARAERKKTRQQTAAARRQSPAPKRRAAGPQ